MKKIVKTTDLVKNYGKIQALNKLNLNIPEGITGFIGPNGSGKTTTFNILMGFLKADFGEAYVLDYDCSKDSDKIRKICNVVFEKNWFPKNLTVYYFLEHIAKIRNIKNRNEEILRVLKEVKLEKEMNKKIGQLSAGLMQRLAISQVLLYNPVIIFLDEPTSNLDPLSRISILRLIKRLNKEKGINFVISSHSLFELELICNWFSVIYKGKLIKEGDKDELAKEYSSNKLKVNSSNNKLLIEKLKTFKNVKEIEEKEKHIYVKIINLDDFYSELHEVLTNEKLILYELAYETKSLAEIFEELIKKEESL